MRALGWFALVIAVGLAGVLVQVPRYRVDPEEPALIERNATVRDAFMSSALSAAASSLDSTGNYVWGRTTEPHFSLDLHRLNAFQQYTEMKEFVWVGVNSGPWLVSWAVMQLQYADNLVLQVYRRDDDGGRGSSLKARVTLPLLSPIVSWGTEWVANITGGVGPRSRGHRVRYQSPPWAPPAHAYMDFTGTELHFDVGAVVAGEWEGVPRSTATVRVQGKAALPAQAMGLVFPLGPHRPSLVYKAAAARLVPGSTTLTVTVADRAPTPILLADGLLSLDYTRGLLRRVTRWYWACLSDPASGLGFHLSAGTYDVDGVSMEATLFDSANGTATFLDERVLFTRRVGGAGAAVPPPWHAWDIRSPSVSLVFTPRDGYGGAAHLGVVDVNLDHQWGTFTGTVRHKDGRIIYLENAPGVLEEHYALW